MRVSVHAQGGENRVRLPAPYYQDEWVTLYHGDALRILPKLPPGDTILTDPPWPGAPEALSGSADPERLFRHFCRLAPARARRLAVWLGCFTDPRLLRHIPEALPFVTRIPVLRFPQKPRGKRTAFGEIVYVFGSDEVNPGRTLLPGLSTERSWVRRIEENDHPCPSNLAVARFLVEHLVPPGGTVLDPFCGSGTILAAAKAQGRKAIGIEIQERWCRTVVRRQRQQVFDFREGGAAE